MFQEYEIGALGIETTSNPNKRIQKTASTSHHRRTTIFIFLQSTHQMEKGEPVHSNYIHVI